MLRFATILKASHGLGEGDMHEPLVPADHLDDFIIVRATAFVSKIQRTMARDVLRKEGLPVLEWRLMFSVARFGSCHLAYITRRTSIDPAHGSRAASALESEAVGAACGHAGLPASLERAGGAV